MKAFWTIAFHLLVCLISFSSFCIELNDQSSSRDLVKADYSVYEDTTGALNFKDFASKWRSGKWNEATVNVVRNQKSAYWLVMPFTNSSSKDHWVLEAKDHHISDFSVFVGGDQLNSGASLPFNSRKYEFKNFIFDLPQTSKSRIFIRIKADSPVSFELAIKKVTDLVAYSTSEYYLLGFYYGILVIMALYNLLLFVSARERVYLWYILYVAACILVSLEEDGTGFQYVWPSFPGFNYALTNLFAPVIFMLSFIVYSITFLDLKRKSKKSFFALCGVGLVYILAQFSNVFIFPSRVVVGDYFFIPFLAVFVVAIRRFRSGDRFSRYFILGNMFVFTSVLVNFLRGHYLIPANVFTVYSFNIGVLLEIVVLSFALGDRIRILKKEKEKSQSLIIEQLNENKILQNKVNAELEEKVQQRTSELESKTLEALESKEKLAELSDQLLKMNEQLDKKNWTLSKGIKEQSYARLSRKGLEYAEFMSLYPEDSSCLLELERIKWGTGFACRKCGNTGFSKKVKLQTRKCSSCGTEESATSRTLFHGTRMALSAAFYITYLEINDPTKLTIEELSHQLGIHRNTCSKFKAKVAAHLSAENPNGTDRVWGDLLLVS